MLVSLATCLAFLRNLLPSPPLPRMRLHLLFLLPKLQSTEVPAVPPCHSTILADNFQVFAYKADTIVQAVINETSLKHRKAEGNHQVKETVFFFGLLHSPQFFSW